MYLRYQILDDHSVYMLNKTEKSKRKLKEYATMLAKFKISNHMFH